ncbi:5'/3'-nucleotidase SurE [Candidatus Palauibacter sp.]|uniref:5'/3'-nucleotidase SurE n=1 Tax=Candidatus Palauibacter sp. TaxID=3101350 RepID=UPI003AF3096A
MHTRTATDLTRRSSSIVHALAAFACSAVVACTVEPAAETREAAEAESPYHILVTNDDGIESPGIQELAAELGKVGEVTVVAPCGERSGSSMSILLGQGIRLRDFPEGGELAGQCVDATPAGAVLFAIDALAPESGFDVVVSGINRGANVGDVSHMSGTVGAAMMGAYHGVPSVAASLGDGSAGFEYAARVVARFVDGLRHRQPEPGVVYSINLPRGTEADTRGVTARPMGGSYIRVEYEEIEGTEGARVFRPRFAASDPYPAGSDSEAYDGGLITITPLRFDWTDRPSLEELEGWDLEGLARDGG